MTITIAQSHCSHLSELVDGLKSYRSSHLLRLQIIDQVRALGLSIDALLDQPCPSSDRIDDGKGKLVTAPAQPDEGGG